MNHTYYFSFLVSLVTIACIFCYSAILAKAPVAPKAKAAPAVQPAASATPSFDQLTEEQQNQAMQQLVRTAVDAAEAQEVRGQAVHVGFIEFLAKLKDSYLTKTTISAEGQPIDAVISALPTPVLEDTLRNLPYEIYVAIIEQLLCDKFLDEQQQKPFYLDGPTHVSQKDIFVLLAKKTITIAAQSDKVDEATKAKLAQLLPALAPIETCQSTNMVELMNLGRKFSNFVDLLPQQIEQRLIQMNLMAGAAEQQAPGGALGVFKNAAKKAKAVVKNVYDQKDRFNRIRNILAQRINS